MEFAPEAGYTRMMCQGMSGNGVSMLVWSERTVDRTVSGRNRDGVQNMLNCMNNWPERTSFLMAYDMSRRTS
jgi:hypothetical protein